MKSPLLLCTLLLTAVLRAEPREFSGIYPSLAMFNDEGECGTGAVVPWADRLWVITYGPHLPNGSSDKLYEITPDLQQIVRTESIGGTPANRMIHKESGQLFIGPYAIDAQKNVRTIPYSTMFGRLTGLARDLDDPAKKIVFATMEEGVYEVDVKTLEARALWADEQVKSGRHADLPGYHGKGFYSGQGRYLYANNGDHAKEALTNPAVLSGVLAEWDGKADHWTVVRRNQFTEVTGPGGIDGSKKDDPVWSIGWDHRSLILMMLDGGKWQAFRLPKASNSYDGAHGWNTEWPRIREVDRGPLLMTMHGMLWDFPRTFSAARTAGIKPLSSYVKVIGDFCGWKDQIVFGCDDTAKNEFLNKRKAKGSIAPPQSQSNLWFLKRQDLRSLGPYLSQGGVWLNDDVPAGRASDPYLFDDGLTGSVRLSHEGNEPVNLTIEWDESGNGKWTPWFQVTLPPHGGQWVKLFPGDWVKQKDASWKYDPLYPPDGPPNPGGEGRGRGIAGTGVNPLARPWIRVACGKELTRATALFCTGSARYQFKPGQDDLFSGIAAANDANILAGTVRARGENKRTLHYAPAGGDTLYELDAELNLLPVNDPDALRFHRENGAIPAGVLTVDAASVIYTDDSGRRWRLPKGDPSLDRDTAAGPARVCREVCTERDLFNAHGTFYELPAENAGGFARVRPVCTHNRRIHDYCSWRGLLILSGIAAAAPAGDHIIRSDDGKAALWAGAVDDLWKFGPPRGTGGAWKDTTVKKGVSSDPCLLWGFWRRTVTVSHTAPEAVNVQVEMDLTGDGRWVEWKTLTVPTDETISELIPREVQARWVRFTPDKDCTATAKLTLE